MEELSNNLLIDSYKKAKELGLDESFILILDQEIRRRSIARVVYKRALIKSASEGSSDGFINNQKFIKWQRSI